MSDLNQLVIQARLRELAREHRRLQRHEEDFVEQVQDLQASGATWQQIADTLGMFKQSVHRKYRKRVAS